MDDKQEVPSPQPTTPTPASNHPEKWKTVLTVIFLLFANLIGLILMWLWMKWPLWVKVLITIFSLLFAVLVFIFFAAVLNQVQNIQSNTSTINTNPVATPGLAENLPTPPEGFSWATCFGDGAHLLQPDGWFIKKETGTNLEACFITREEIKGEDGLYSTGLTAQKAVNVSAQTQTDPVQYGEHFLNEVAKDPGFKATPIEKFDKGNFKGLSRTVTASDFKAFYLVLADQENDLDYIFWFEAPPNIYDEELKSHGNVILNNIGIRL